MFVLVLYGILLAILLGIWAWTRRAAWSIPVVIVALLLVAAWLNFRWEVTGLLILAVVIIALAILFARLVIGLVLGGLALLLAVALAFGFGIPNTTSTTTAPNPPNADTIKALTITTATYTCQKDSNGLVAFDIGALKPVNAEGRKWSDAVSTPFKATTPATMSDELMATICHDPEMGAMVANYFANLKLGNFEVASVNPWLNEFKGDGGSVIHVKAASYIGLLNVKDPTNEQVATAATKNKDYQALAAKVNTLLSKFIVGGINADQSASNYHLLGGGLVADSLPAIGLNTEQEQLPALQLFLTQKGQEECLVKIGFNAGDMRLETFPCTKPSQPSTPAGPSAPTGPSTTPVAPVPPGVPTPVTTPPTSVCTVCGTPGCTSACSTTPPVVPTCPIFGTPPNCYGPKDPSRSTQNQGNNRAGGGGLAPVQTDPVGPPAGGQPPATYTPPAPPAAVAPAPAAGGPTPMPTRVPAPANPQLNPTPAPGQATPPANSGDPGLPAGF